MASTSYNERWDANASLQTSVSSKVGLVLPASSLSPASERWCHVSKLEGSRIWMLWHVAGVPRPLGTMCGHNVRRHRQNEIRWILTEADIQVKLLHKTLFKLNTESIIWDKTPEDKTKMGNDKKRDFPSLHDCISLCSKSKGWIDWLIGLFLMSDHLESNWNQCN